MASFRKFANFMAGAELKSENRNARDSLVRAQQEKGRMAVERDEFSPEFMSVLGLVDGVICDARDFDYILRSSDRAQRAAEELLAVVVAAAASVPCTRAHDPATEPVGTTAIAMEECEASRSSSSSDPKSRPRSDRSQKTGNAEVLSRCRELRGEVDVLIRGPKVRQDQWAGLAPTPCRISSRGMGRHSGVAPKVQPQQHAQKTTASRAQLATEVKIKSSSLSGVQASKYYAEARSALEPAPPKATCEAPKTPLVFDGKNLSVFEKIKALEARTATPAKNSVASAGAAGGSRSQSRQSAESTIVDKAETNSTKAVQLQVAQAETNSTKELQLQAAQEQIPGSPEEPEGADEQPPTTDPDADQMPSPVKSEVIVVNPTVEQGDGCDIYSAPTTARDLGTIESCVQSSRCSCSEELAVEAVVEREASAIASTEEVGEEDVGEKAPMVESDIASLGTLPIGDLPQPPSISGDGCTLSAGFEACLTGQKCRRSATLCDAVHFPTIGSPTPAVSSGTQRLDGSFVSALGTSALLSPTKQPTQREDPRPAPMRLVQLPPKVAEDNYEISEHGGDSDTDEEEAAKIRKHKHVPKWVDTYLKQVKLQADMDADSIFSARVPEVVLEDLFPESLYTEMKKSRPKRQRGSSGNWRRDPLTFSEIQNYKARLGQVRCWEEPDP